MATSSSTSNQNSPAIIGETLSLILALILVLACVVFAYESLVKGTISRIDLFTYVAAMAAFVYVRFT